MSIRRRGFVSPGKAVIRGGVVGAITAILLVGAVYSIYAAISPRLDAVIVAYAVSFLGLPAAALAFFLGAFVGWLLNQRLLSKHHTPVPAPSMPLPPPPEVRQGHGDGLAPRALHDRN